MAVILGGIMGVDLSLVFRGVFQSALDLGCVLVRVTRDMTLRRTKFTNNAVEVLILRPILHVERFCKLWKYSPKKSGICFLIVWSFNKHSEIKNIWNLTASCSEYMQPFFCGNSVIRWGSFIALHYATQCVELNLWNDGSNSLYAHLL
jgi:hypothetical protein